MTNDALAWTSLAAAFGFWLIVALALVESFDKRRQRRHERDQSELLLLIERQRTARKWLEAGICPDCGAPSRDDGPFDRAIDRTMGDPLQ